MNKTQEEFLYDNGEMLRPCPFCGAAPEVHPVGSGFGDDWAMVKCNNEYCHAMPKVEVRGQSGGLSGEMASAANRLAARRLWNKRA